MDAYLLLGEIYERQKNFKEAEALYQKALNTESLNPQIRQTFEARLYAVKR